MIPLLVSPLNDLYKLCHVSDGERRQIYNAKARNATARIAAPREPKFLDAAPVYGGDEDDPGEPGVLVPDGAMGAPVAEEPAPEPVPAPRLPVGIARPPLPVALAYPEEPMTREELDEMLVEWEVYLTFLHLT